MPGERRILAGAMSGTSADGVDVALVEIAGRGLGMSAQLLHHHHCPYDSPLKSCIFRIRDSGSVQLSELAQLARNISLCYAGAINDALVAAKLRPSDIAAVAAHGQTLYHDPPNTIQWLDPAIVASEIGCAVVSDFRRADCAAGGQGAPLVPFADYIMFRHSTKNRALLNVGGIANVTYLKSGGSIDEVVAFDTGPGNCISDWICRTKLGVSRDDNGERALRGHPHFQTAFMSARMKYPFAPPPKSTDSAAMIELFVLARDTAKFTGNVEDELATACSATAHTIAMSLSLGETEWWRGSVDEVLVSGGGTKNGCIMRELRQLLEPRSVGLLPLDELTAQSKEAVAFALLGAATLDGIPSNVPSVTGAKRAVVLGSITPKP